MKQTTLHLLGTYVMIIFVLFNWKQDVSIVVLLALFVQMVFLLYKLLNAAKKQIIHKL